MEARKYSVLAKLFKLINLSSICLCCYMAHGIHVTVYLERASETTLLRTEGAVGLIDLELSLTLNFQHLVVPAWHRVCTQKKSEKMNE